MSDLSRLDDKLAAVVREADMFISIGHTELSAWITREGLPAAMAMVRQGAAEMMPQAELTPEILLAKLTELLRSPMRLEAMAAHARAAAKPEALQRIAALVVGLRKPGF